MESQYSVQRVKNRGWLSLTASIGIIVLMSAVWIYVMRAISIHGSFDPANSQLFWQTFVAFALVILSGVIGTMEAVVQITTGRRNGILTFMMIVVFVSAIVTATMAGSSHL